MRRQKKATALEQQEPRCGSCRFWRRYDRDPEQLRGRCMFNPPTVLVDPEDDQPMTVWPLLMVDDHVCSKFDPKQ